MSKPIIAAVDPRREDVAPAALGVLLARLTGAPLVIASTYSVDLAVDNLHPEYARTMRLDTERALRPVAAAAEAAGVPVRTTAVPADDSPARALHEFAEDADAKLLVIGSSARGPLGRLLPGAVTDRLLHGAPCPVAVAPIGYTFADVAADPALIGVAFTDTPNGHAALAMTRELATRARARVRVLTVAPPLDLLVTGSLTDSLLEDVRRARHEAAAAVVRIGTDVLPDDRFADGQILSGRPADALAAASEDLGLLVCGSRGYGPLRTLLLGGTSHALVRKAACPVLVVPPGSSEHAVSGDPSSGRTVAA
jgi:nucleotide-binding universal stress UspA family protein